MKAIVLFILISLHSGLFFAQSLPILTDQLIEPSKQQPFKNFVEYKIDGMVLYNGEGKESKYFYIIDKNTGAKIFEYDQKVSKAKHFVPKFFGVEGAESTIILCMGLEGNYSWGIHIFIIDNGEVSYSGFLSYGVDNFNFASLALYSQFEQHDDWFIMFFNEDTKIINYATDDLMEGSELEFKIEKDKITRIK